MVYNLFEIILNNSIENRCIKLALLEWDVINIYDNGQCIATCLCSHPKIRYEFTIQNRYNRNILKPIGSSCILKFEYIDIENNHLIRQMYSLLDILISRKKFPKRIEKVLIKIKIKQDKLKEEERLQKAQLILKKELFESKLINLKRNIGFKKVNYGKYQDWLIGNVYRYKKDYIEYLIQNNHYKNFKYLIFFYKLNENHFKDMYELNIYINRENL